jgi:hypothetical protein
MSPIEESYLKQVDSQIKENKATRRFYEYELKRGEDLVDEMPINPYYEYRMTDLKIEEQKYKETFN